MECDVLIVGSGGAALRAALAARDQGVEVILITKGKYGYCGATASGVAELGGFLSANGFTDPEDTPDVFYHDIIKSAAGMADPKIVRTLVDNSFRAFKELEDYGVHFERNEDGSYKQVQSEFTSKPRMHILKKHGIPIVRTLMEHAVNQGVKVIDKSMVTKLLVKNNRVIGATALDSEGKLIYIKAKAVILGTGGAGQLFKFNLNTKEMTGDGYALGYRAGAKLMNMEFIQCGIGFIHPFKNILHPWAWSIMPKMMNGRGEEFLHKYLPSSLSLEECFVDRGTYYPFSTTHPSYVLDAAIKKELLTGNGTARGGVYLDYSECGSREVDQTNTNLASLWPHLKDWLLTRNIDVTKQPLEVSVFGHALNGGMQINDSAETAVELLFAAGEGAAGPHGADRAGGQMLMNSQVFGRIAGEEAARRVKDMPFEDANDQFLEEKSKMASIERMRGKISSKAIFKKIQHSMWESLIITRSSDGLTRNLNIIEELRDEMKDIGIGDAADIRRVLEIENMLEVGEIITRAALERTESRGGHYREDHPDKDEENWRKWIVFSKADDTMKLEIYDGESQKLTN